MLTDAERRKKRRIERAASAVFYTVCVGIIAAVFLGVIALADLVL